MTDDNLIEICNMDFNDKSITDSNGNYIYQNNIDPTKITFVRYNKSYAFHASSTLFSENVTPLITSNIISDRQYKISFVFYTDIPFLYGDGIAFLSFANNDYSKILSFGNYVTYRSATAGYEYISYDDINLNHNYNKISEKIPNFNDSSKKYTVVIDVDNENLTISVTINNTLLITYNLVDYFSPTNVTFGLPNNGCEDSIYIDDIKILAGEEQPSYEEPTLTLSQSNNTLTATATVDPNLQDQTVSYLWGNGETTQSIDITVSGTYSCTITDSIGQTATQSISAEYVEPIAQPTVTITKSEYVLTAIATVDARLQDQTVSYLWSNNATTNSITVSETGTYYCTVTDSIGQTATASYYVVVNYDPVVIITKNKDTCQRGENITLSGFNSYCTNSFITSYVWSTGDDEATIEVTPTQTTTYTLTVTAANGRSSSSSVMVVVESGQIELMKYLPEYWHPNAEMQQIQQNTLNYSLYNLHNAYNVITTEAYIGTSNNARLTEWEHDLGITSSDTLEERRRNILSFFKRKGKLDEENIRLIVNNFANGADCIVEFIPSYIRILIRPRHENETVFPKVESIINAKKPAHLGLYVERYYCTWGEVKDSFDTWNDVKNKGSWNDVRLFLPYIYD